MEKIIIIHASAAMVSLLLGPWFIFFRKNLNHKKILIYVWALLMLFVATSSFWIKTINLEEMSFIHILSAVTILGLLESFYLKLKNHPIKTWTRPLFGIYIGLVLAGLGTLVPGRLMGGMFSKYPYLYGFAILLYFIFVYYISKKQNK